MEMNTAHPTFQISTNTTKALNKRRFKITVIY